MDLLLALAAATALLVMIPGPNVALIVATSIALGPRRSLLTVAGTTLGVGLQLSLVVFGMAAAVAAAAEVLVWLKWAGVAYLIYLGIRAWTAPVDDLTAIEANPATGRRLFWSGLTIALVNPKTLVFNSAFLPQFVSQTSQVGIGLQFALAGAVFLTVMALGDALWALLAGRARVYLKGHGVVRNKISGAFLIGAGAVLALARR